MDKALDSQSSGPVFKTTVWLQSQLNLSSFRGRSKPVLPGHLVTKSKLPPQSGSVALRQLSPIHKKGP